MTNVESVIKQSERLLKNKIPDLSLESLIEYLKGRSEVHINGKMGTETYVNKAALRLAAAYLQDYLDIQNNDI